MLGASQENIRLKVKMAIGNKDNRTGFQLHPELINRRGRPKKGECLSDILKSLLDTETIEIEGKTFTWKEAIGRKLCELALRGDKSAIALIYDRLEGRPPVNNSLIDIEDNELHITVTTADENLEVKEKIDKYLPFALKDRGFELIDGNWIKKNNEKAYESFEK